MRWRRFPLRARYSVVLALAAALTVTAAAWALEHKPAASRAVRVIDGDTIDLGGERVRIENLDAPEMPGRARCYGEAQLALAAKAKLSTILGVRGARIELVRDLRRPLDKYGRTLARVTVDGLDVAGPMIGAGVARPWQGRSSDWCR